MVDLSLQDKQLHWTVVGPLFRPLHLQIDELVEAWRELADTVAERLSRSRSPEPQRRVRNEDADESFAQPLVFADAAHRVRSAKGVLTGDHQVAVRSDRQIDRAEPGIGDEARCAHRSATIEHDDCLAPRRTLRCPTRDRASRRGQARTARERDDTIGQKRFRAAVKGGGRFPVSSAESPTRAVYRSIRQARLSISTAATTARWRLLDMRGAVVRDSGRVPA